MQRAAPPGPPRSGRPPGPPGGSSPGPGPGDGIQITRDMRGVPDDDEKLWGMVAHVAGVFVPVLGPLAMWALKREESEFVAYHCAQALWWSTITVVGTVVLSIVTCGAGSVVFPLFWLGSAYVALEAKEGSWIGYWVINRFGYHRKLV
ncbi:MAG: DUF4870 domain-containing protein [Alphaproteobacteria bacterium]|nr:DUF4870 domain-containing protein [Myxococcales bacterium]MCB9675889.1 DUF4870 domain-containing protein [Alphaproteobacteria bacterium]